MNDVPRSALAELIGTFTLTFIGAGAGIMAARGDGNLLTVALAHGVALLVIVYAWGSISGAHVNPAVTLGIAITGRIPWSKAAAYWVAQFVGAILAAYLLVYIVNGQDRAAMETVGSLTRADAVRTIVVEAVLTFFLLIAVFASGVGARSGNAAGVAIGLVLTMDILAGGPLTGASMNPARTLGPALANGNFNYVWMYFVGPFIGGSLGAILYDRLYLPAADVPPVEAAEEHRNLRR